jgi:NAD(P)-dependent dehydrogenase (short-subunit alcohol dehydrogenase family)
MSSESNGTTIVVGASRGLGRGIAATLAQAGLPVVALGRSGEALEDLAGEIAGIEPVTADATDPTLPGNLIGRYSPRALVLVAGARPLPRPLQEQTWETFSVNWETDVRMAFEWVGEALRRPLAPGGRVIVMSSGAALRGSPLSGGYAGAKAAQRFIAAYAQEEADRARLGISFTSILPRITPLTGLGRPAVEAYAARAGISEDEYMQAMGPVVTPEAAGAAVLELIQAEPASLARAYMLTGAGVNPLE